MNLSVFGLLQEQVKKVEAEIADVKNKIVFHEEKVQKLAAQLCDLSCVVTQLKYFQQGSDGIENETSAKVAQSTTTELKKRASRLTRASGDHTPLEENQSREILALRDGTPTPCTFASVMKKPAPSPATPSKVKILDLDNYLGACPVIVPDREGNWRELRCDMCGVNVTSSNKFFSGWPGFHRHILAAHGPLKIQPGESNFECILRTCTVRLVEQGEVQKINDGKLNIMKMGKANWALTPSSSRALITSDLIQERDEPRLSATPEPANPFLKECPVVVCNDVGKWAQLACHVCARNTTLMKTFFKGCKALYDHLKNNHRDIQLPRLDVETERQYVLRTCSVREFEEDEIENIKSGDLKIVKTYGKPVEAEINGNEGGEKDGAVEKRENSGETNVAMGEEGGSEPNERNQANEADEINEMKEIIEANMATEINDVHDANEANGTNGLDGVEEANGKSEANEADQGSEEAIRPSTKRLKRFLVESDESDVEEMSSAVATGSRLERTCQRGSRFAEVQSRLKRLRGDNLLDLEQETSSRTTRSSEPQSTASFPPVSPSGFYYE